MTFNHKTINTEQDPVHFTVFHTSRSLEHNTFNIQTICAPKFYLQMSKKGIYRNEPSNGNFPLPFHNHVTVSMTPSVHEKFHLSPNQRKDIFRKQKSKRFIGKDDCKGKCLKVLPDWKNPTMPFFPDSPNLVSRIGRLSFSKQEARLDLDGPYQTKSLDHQLVQNSR